MGVEKVEKGLIEYSVESSHTSTIHHELLFSISKGKFIKPSYGDKSKGKLVYKLLPGTYGKFELFVSETQNIAHLSVLLIHINLDGNIESKEIFETKTSYTDLQQIINDPNAPRILVDFLQMIPRYHSTAVVFPSNYSEDFYTAVEKIKNYFEKRASK
jgi:hypothetical protein